MLRCGVFASILQFVLSHKKEKSMLTFHTSTVMTLVSPKNVHLAFWYQLQLKILILPQNKLLSEWQCYLTYPDKALSSKVDRMQRLMSLKNQRTTHFFEKKCQDTLDFLDVYSKKPCVFIYIIIYIYTHSNPRNMNHIYLFIYIL